MDKDKVLALALDHHREGRFVEAETSYRSLLAEDPEDVNVWYLLSVMACQVGQHAAALELTDQALRLRPDIAQTWSNRGIALKSLGRHVESLESFSRAIDLNPGFAESFEGRAEGLLALGRCSEALADSNLALELRPFYPEAHNGRGNALYCLGQYDEALKAYTEAIRFRLDYAEAWCNRGIALCAQSRWEDAIAECDEAIRLRPEFAEAYFYRGNAQRGLQRDQEALQSYGNAIKLKPDFADAYFNRGVALEALSQTRAALADYDSVISLNESHAEAHNNRGVMLQRMLRYREALESFDRSISVKPCVAGTHSNRANALLALGDFGGAAQSCEDALVLEPNFDWLPGLRLYLRRFMCEWKGIDEERRNLEDAVFRGERVATPFCLLAGCDSPAVLRQAAVNYVHTQCPPPDRDIQFPLPGRSGKIRIGYYSADFHGHATSYLMAEVFERHDRDRFEILGFSFGSESNDAMRTRVSQGMDQFLDVRDKTDEQIARLSRELDVNIAVDLKGLTMESRIGIFANRAAPVQVTYLGYPGTTGADFMDYLIADAVVIPPGSCDFYSEKIVWLPHTYQANDSKRPRSPRVRTYAQAGLPNNAFVFCCFNGAYKITPSVFDSWMRILERVPESVLWLLDDNPTARENLLKEAARRGIRPTRLVFAPQLPLADHLARVGSADLFLDTFPYGAHTTASDALWAGVPLITRAGENFSSRVGASLLRAFALPELITSSQPEYEETAIKLALDPDRFRVLRDRVRENRLTTPLFACAAFTRHLEAAYKAIYEQHRAGLPPAHVRIFDNGTSAS